MIKEIKSIDQLEYPVHPKFNRIDTEEGAYLQTCIELKRGDDTWYLPFSLQSKTKTFDYFKRYFEESVEKIKRGYVVSDANHVTGNDIYKLI